MLGLKLNHVSKRGHWLLAARCETGFMRENPNTLRQLTMEDGHKNQIQYTPPVYLLINKAIGKDLRLRYTSLSRSLVRCMVSRLCTGEVMWGFQHMFSEPGQHTAECRYNTVQYNTIFHTTLRWLKQNINLRVKSQITPYNASWGASYGVYFVRIREKIDRVITALHCIQYSQRTIHTVHALMCFVVVWTIYPFL